ncbi:MAG TPA: diguanylate cyclase [Micromonosporaceae bacterium]
MTLRGRLTAAFLTVVLGPVLFGAFFVGRTLTIASHERAVDRLDSAATSVRTALGALCQQLRAAAEVVAVLPDAADRPQVAEHVVTRGLAGVITVADPSGALIYQTSAAPPRPWLECAKPPAPAAVPGALVAQVEIRSPAGTLLGTVTAAQILDAELVARLAAATGVEITLLRDGPSPAVVHSTEPIGRRTEVVAAATGLRGEDVAEAGTDRYIRRVGPSADQPLPLVLSVPLDDTTTGNAVLAGAVALAGLFGVIIAWHLARTSTRPLAELAEAAARVGQGDLTARVPVRGQDEAGELARAFNRMTREIQAYVHALTASRDQLRGHVEILGDTLSSTHDLERILKLILRTALAATSARAGLVLLRDPTTGRLVGRAVEGADELAPQGGWPVPIDDRPATLQLPPGSGILGTVAVTGEPLRGRVGRDDPRPAPGEPHGQTYIAVPISVPGDTAGAAGPIPVDTGGTPPRDERPAPGLPALGVLAVYDRLCADEFDERDLATLRTFAGQAAVAVENVRTHDEVQRLSLTDPLTGLGNYRHLKASLHRMLGLAERSGRPFALLALDLDRFKEINDTHGHVAGDQVLVEFARRIRAVVREVDLAFRQGGEEFVVLLPDTDTRGGVIVAERLGAAIRDTPIRVRRPTSEPGAPTVTVSITVSIGIAVYPSHAKSGPQLLDMADRALYSAKAAGRDSYRLAELPGGGSGTSSVAPPPRQSHGR